jgi:hypothetical protein
MNSLASPHITIRPAYPDDEWALWQLAELDSGPIPPEPLVLVEIDGHLAVAVSRSDLTAIADPFVPTAHIVELVRDHVRRAAAPATFRRVRRKPALAAALRAL